MNNHRPRPAFSRAILVIAGIVVFVLALVMVLVVVTIDRRLSRAMTPASGLQAAQANYARTEGPTNRGPAFEQLVLTLDHWRSSGGPAVTEASMVQMLGPPDLMLRNATGDTFVYFYDRFGQDDWAVYFDFASGVLTIGYNDAAVNVQQHAQMIPYSPPIPTTGPSTLPGSSLAPLQP